MIFRKKPVEIDAEQLTWGNLKNVCDFANVGKLEDGQPQLCYIGMCGQALPQDSVSAIIGMHIPTLEGVMLARQGDWIIRGVKNELYACRGDIFEETYELVEDKPVRQKPVPPKNVRIREGSDIQRPVGYHEDLTKALSHPRYPPESERPPVR